MGEVCADLGTNLWPESIGLRAADLQGVDDPLPPAQRLDAMGRSHHHAAELGLVGWRKFLLKSGLPHVRFRDLRHAHATLMLLQGVHPKVVSERLGHASVGITLDTYSHVLPSMQSDAVRAFDDLFRANP